MKDWLIFAVGMMLSALLIGEAWFGVIRPADRSASQKRVRFVPTERPDPRDGKGPEPPEEPGADYHEKGKPAPLQPRPGHHLVAANALPPDDGVYLLPRD